ncbi:MAG TPA: NAD(P)-binding oxidoreductase [Kofleriaceae bacterium]|nr:NAD(P)-binding oxidoreductase [Kofleriaceae bacterium]
MRIVVIGAAGGTGTQVVEQAVAAGHGVIAAVRRPDAYKGQGRVVKADVLDAASVQAAVAGVDAVISTYGPADLKHPGTLMSEGVTNIVRACEAAGVKRFVFESGLMTSDGTGQSLGGRIGLVIVRRIYKHAMRDKRLAEEAMRASSLDYVIVRPVMLVDGPAKGTFVHGVDRRVNPMKKLAHADVAAFLLRCAQDPELARTTQTIGEA